MKIKLLKPLYLNNHVVLDGEVFETSDLHGRELISKGYALVINDKDEADSDKVVKKTHLKRKSR